MSVVVKSRSSGQSTVQVHPVTPTVGARIDGVDVASVNAGLVAELRAALLRHKVIFLREQAIGADEFLAFAESLGPTTLHHPVVKAGENQVSDEASLRARANVWERDNKYRSDHWHTDVSFTDRPVAFTLLRCIETPTDAGDTLFANTAAAYASLPDPLKTLADGLRVIHSMRNGMHKTSGWNNAQLAWLTEHPLVRVHSETGERSLLVGSFAERIIGLGHSASWKLLEIFQEHILKPEHMVRWTWRAGDLAIWDNRATQHYAVNDYGGASRVMQRLTVAGGRPVGVDGQESRPITGDATTFSVLGVS